MTLCRSRGPASARPAPLCDGGQGRSGLFRMDRVVFVLNAEQYPLSSGECATLKAAPLEA
jgi:hypothetical protein